MLQIEDDILTISKGVIPGAALHNDRVVLSEIAFKNMSLEGTSGSVQIIFTLQYAVGENSITTYVPGKTFQTSFTLAQ